MCLRLGFWLGEPVCPCYLPSDQKESLPNVWQQVLLIPSRVQGAHHESRLPWNLRPRQRRCVRFSPGAAAALPQCVPDVREPDTGSSKKPKDNRKKGPLTPLPRGWNRCTSSAAGPGPGSEKRDLRLLLASGWGSYEVKIFGVHDQPFSSWSGAYQHPPC